MFGVWVGGLCCILVRRRWETSLARLVPGHMETAIMENFPQYRFPGAKLAIIFVTSY